MPRDPAGPRAPDEQHWTGTGTPRSADDGLPQPGTAGEQGEADPAVETGMAATSQPAAADEVRINRSGSGGSGGPLVGGEGEEGSAAKSMSELLAGEEDDLGDDG